MSSCSSRYPELRKDPIFDRWVIFSPARSRRPSDFKSHQNPNNPNPNSCPFCVGHESECAPEIFRFPNNSTNGWRVRVIENLYPALRREEEVLLDRKSSNLVVAGFGFHDVVIEAPTHSCGLVDLGDEEAGEVVRAYRKRILQLKLVGSVKYVQSMLGDHALRRESRMLEVDALQVFKNHGPSAGASMTHSHSQIMGLPIVPPSVSTRLNSMKEVFDQTRKCGLCDARSEDTLINESIHFFAVVPFAASFPFEIWIIPRDHTSYFHDIDDEKAVDFGALLKLMLLKLSRQLNDPPFNFMIHSTPFDLEADRLPYTHWFLQIVPQLSIAGGFEMGSGCYINPVFPEDAAKLLREVDCKK